MNKKTKIILTIFIFLVFALLAFAFVRNSAGKSKASSPDSGVCYSPSAGDCEAK